MPSAEPSGTAQVGGGPPPMLGGQGVLQTWAEQAAPAGDKGLSGPSAGAEFLW